MALQIVLPGHSSDFGISLFAGPLPEPVVSQEVDNQVSYICHACFFGVAGVKLTSMHFQTSGTTSNTMYKADILVVQ